MKIVAISDTHLTHGQLRIPDGDVLVHAGDATNRGTLEELEEFNQFLGRLPHRHKLVIAGNHDFCFERDGQTARRLLTNGLYLQDEPVVVERIKFYGSPWQPRFGRWAFNLDRGAPLKEKWDLIPDDTQVLLTHGPPYGHGDRTVFGCQVGCEELLQAIRRIRPRFHVFGHIHEGAGLTTDGPTVCVNASSVNFWYRPANAPQVLHL